MKALANNRVFAISYRAFAMLLAAWGVLDTVGVFRGELNPTTLLAYTIQSNILVMVFFAVLLVKTITAKDAKSYGFYPRLATHITLAITVTMLVTWCILMPTGMWKMGFAFVFGMQNLTVHMFTALLMIGDLLIFQERGRLKKADLVLCAVIPYLYLLEVMPLGLTHTMHYDALGIDSYYPYLFLDVDRFGWLVLLMIVGLTLFFIGLMAGWYRVDKKLAKGAQ
ncbi:MAG: hypothetical protein LBJ43_00675 [Propionibacteriaceae bacterium]|nr:hypothetical protein [Propionibacteriaceae bacterium]